MFVAFSQNTQRGIAQRAAQRVQALPPPVVAPEPPRAPVGLAEASNVIAMPLSPAHRAMEAERQAHLASLRKPPVPHRASSKEIIARVGAWHGYTLDDMLSKDRRRPIVVAKRDAAVALRYTFPAASLAWLGNQMGIDHTTYLHHLKARGVK